MRGFDNTVKDESSRPFRLEKSSGISADELAEMRADDDGMCIILCHPDAIWFDRIANKKETPR